MDLPAFEIAEPADTELRSESYAQAVPVRVGHRVEITGPGGWTRTGEIPGDVRTEIGPSCDTIANVLEGAGASWSDVTAVREERAGGVER